MASSWCGQSRIWLVLQQWKHSEQTVWQSTMPWKSGQTILRALLCQSRLQWTGWGRRRASFWDTNTCRKSIFWFPHVQFEKKIVRSNTACAHSYVQWAFHILLLRQVQQIYVLMNVECKMCNLHLDSWGVKRLVSLCLRRFRRDIVTFRDPELLFMDISFILADIVSVI